MRNVEVSPELKDLEKIYSTLMRCMALRSMAQFTPMRRADLINFDQRGRHALGGGIVSYPGYHVLLPIANGWKKFMNIQSELIFLFVFCILYTSNIKHNRC